MTYVPKFSQVKISVPASVTCSLNNTAPNYTVVFFNGLGGSKTLFVRNDVNVTLGSGYVILTVFSSASKALLGTYSSLVRNTIQGLQNNFTQFVELRGLGYSVSLVGSKLEFKLGYSHTQIFELPSAVLGEIVGTRSRVLKLQSSD